MRKIIYKESSYSEGDITVTKEEINKMLNGEIPYNHERFILFQKGMDITNKRYISEGKEISRRFPKGKNSI